MGFTYTVSRLNQIGFKKKQDILPELVQNPGRLNLKRGIGTRWISQSSVAGIPQFHRDDTHNYKSCGKLL